MGERTIRHVCAVIESLVKYPEYVAKYSESVAKG
jgi:hypothetical protein